MSDLVNKAHIFFGEEDCARFRETNPFLVELPAMSPARAEHAAFSAISVPEHIELSQVKELWLAGLVP